MRCMSTTEIALRHERRRGQVRALPVSQSRMHFRAKSAATKTAIGARGTAARRGERIEWQRQEAVCARVPFFFFFHFIFILFFLSPPPPGP